jgi:hypothetical protein
MGRDKAGNWVADEVVTVVPRQNGKTVLLLARALWGVLLGDERLVVFSAHQFKTARESFLQLKSWCETPALAAYEPVIRTGAGNESVEFPGLGRIQFIARSRTSGRGFSPDCAILERGLRAGRPGARGREAIAVGCEGAADVVRLIGPAPDQQRPTPPLPARPRRRGRPPRLSRVVRSPWTANSTTSAPGPRRTPPSVGG